MTYNFSLYIIAETADGTILQMQSTSIINLDISVENIYIQIELSNIYYFSRLDTKLISLEVLEEKRYELYTINNLL